MSGRYQQRIWPAGSVMIMGVSHLVSLPLSCGNAGPSGNLALRSSSKSRFLPVFFGPILLMYSCESHATETGEMRF